MTSLESNLIENLQKGSNEAFEIIFKTYFSVLTKYAMTFVNTLQEAEDLVEDCFLWIWHKKESITIDSSLRAYLFTLVKHKCLDLKKKEQIKIKYKNQILETHKFDDHHEKPSTLLVKELDEQINDEINKLPNQCRRIFKMNRFEGLKYKEIAEKLDISIATVKTQMSLALTKLKKAFRDYLPLLCICYLKITII